MTTMKSGQSLRDTLWANALAGIDGTDRTYAAIPVTRTLRGALLADCAATATASIQLGSPRSATPPDGTALATATRWRVIGARIQFPGTVTGSNTNFATFTVNHYSQAGLTAAAAASLAATASAMGNVVIYQSVDCTVSAANGVMVASGILACDITKSATTGMTISAGTICEVDVIPEV